MSTTNETPGGATPGAEQQNASRGVSSGTAPLINGAGGESKSLEPDRDQIERFVSALFRHAKPEAYVSMRAFETVVGKDGKPVDRLFNKFSSWLAPEKGLDLLVNNACLDARKAANHPRPVVFCPPIATFNKKDTARAEDLAQGLDISVELDERPIEAA